MSYTIETLGYSINIIRMQGGCQHSVMAVYPMCDLEKVIRIVRELNKKS